MSDAAVSAKTGRDWAAWFGTLDRDGAASLDHRGIVRVLSERHGVGSWWRQMIAVEYERARGLRVRHETAGGFSVAVSKTVPVSLADLYAAASGEAQRRRWLPAGDFRVSSQTPQKYLRGVWNTHGRVAMNFAAKGAGKAQIAVEIGKLDGEAAVAREREAWREALARLAAMLPGHPAP